MDEEKVRYDNYKLYKIKFDTEEQFEFLFDMKVNSTDVSFWQLSRALKYADIMVAPDKIEDFLKKLDEHKIRYTVKMNDVQKCMDRVQSGDKENN